MKNTIFGILTPIIIIIIIVFSSLYLEKNNKYKESTYIVSVENSHNGVNIAFIEPNVENVTQLMLLNYIDSLNVNNKELYFMVIPKEVNKVICDSSINVLRNSKAYMRKVKFYSLKSDIVK